ncbi:carboxymuconolactone decarboxylase [Streptomyces griseocarneus]|uniref:carboxymuconolactone decarboxylase n=1 Tax=Streptomyces griseocarneus TaxID=51201 RepID=UPI00325BE87F
MTAATAARTLVRTALRGSLAQIRHVRAVPPGAAEGTVATVYAASEREFGLLAPPLALHSPAPESLAACWLMLRETLLADGRVSRAAKEAVATGVSRDNSCPYCVDVHRAQVRTLPPDDAAGRLSAWARRGGPRPFPDEDAPEVVGVAVTFHYLNRMVNLFLRDSPVPPLAPAALRGGMLRAVSRVTRPPAPGAPAPGDSLGLLPAAPLPPDLAWAAGRPAVAGPSPGPPRPPTPRATARCRSPYADWSTTPWPTRPPGRRTAPDPSGPRPRRTACRRHCARRAGWPC